MSAAGSGGWSGEALPVHPVPTEEGGGGSPAAVEDLPAVVAAVARGDEEAFELLYDAVAPRILGVARRVLRDPTQAEEVAQEVLVEIWRTAARYEPHRGTVLTWCLTIAHRRAVDRVRSEQAAGEREQRAGWRAVETAHDEVSEEVGLRLEHEQVRRCLDGLTPLQREAITLAYWKGYTYRQVAELLGAPVGTVKARMRDGLVKLRNCLGVET